MNNDTVGHQKQKSQSTQDDEYVGTRVSFMCERIAFYGTVQRCSLSDRSSQQKMLYIKYNGGDEEEIFRPKMNEQRRHYARHGMNDPTLPAILPPQLPPPSTAKKDNTTRTTKQQQPTTVKKKKVPVTNRKKKTATKQRAIKKNSVKRIQIRRKTQQLNQNQGYTMLMMRPLLLMETIHLSCHIRTKYNTKTDHVQHTHLLY